MGDDNRSFRRTKECGDPSTTERDSQNESHSAQGDNATCCPFSLSYCTVKLVALVEVPPVFVMEIFPVLAAAGTVTRMKFAVSTLKCALTPLMATPLVPTKCDP